MKKVFTLLLCVAGISLVRAQAPTAVILPLGKVDMTDLQITSCDFEKDANAEVLFDIGTMLPNADGPLNMYRHTRIKVFNDHGTNEGSVRLMYASYLGAVGLSNLHAETINLENGKIEITPVDKKTIFTSMVDNFTSATTFAMPNVKAGSIIDIEYKEQFPTTWYFQNSIPVRYSEVQTSFSALADYKYLPHVSMPFAKRIGEAGDNNQTRALANVPSLRDEPYMSSREDNLQRIEFINTINTMFNTWQKVGAIIVDYNGFGDALDRNLTGEKDIIKHAKSLSSDDEKIAFIFDTVRNTMRWDGHIKFGITDGITKAWTKKIGNSAEINMMVYDLLIKSGVKAFPLIVSTKESGKMNPIVPTPTVLRNFIVYIPVDSSKSYVLDATSKFNLYSTIASDELNKFGLWMDLDHKQYKPVFMETDEPAIQSISVNAEVRPDGKMAGIAQITSPGYNRTKTLDNYNTYGKEKFIDHLREDDNNLKITSLKIENMYADSLPLVQDIDFNLDLAGSDDSYIYFNPNQLTGMHKNPFVSENRFTDIDFGYRDNLVLNGIYKLPAGYKVDALPKNITMTMPDGSILFRRTLTEQDGTITIRYVISHKKSIYTKDVYPDFHEFYKKLYEMLNEVVVLKKG